MTGDIGTTPEKAASPVSWVYEPDPTTGWSVATCIATDGERTERWQSKSIYISERQRAEVPAALLRRLARQENTDCPVAL